ncbi:MAG: hypothetical protein VX208_10530 [SAR324 cluster bacterium]|jgi:hypothetical protein|nr:hypothetical protein [SAR324 cluster bacterium]
MFSLKEWNFEEYKDEIKEIPDPVERMDEINATYGMTFIERENSDKYIGSKRFSDSQNKLINNRFDKFQAWALNEIESMKIRFSKEIENKKKKAWEGHIRLPFPVVWDRDSYNIIEPDVRKKGKKKEWINWLLKNLNEGNGKKWTYEQWVLNAMENEDYYLGFAEHEYEINYPSILVGALDDQFIVFLFNVQKVLSLKDEKKRKRAIDRELIEIERSELDKIILKTVKLRKSTRKSLHWNHVLRDLKNHTGEGQRIVLSEILAPDESMKEGISLYIDGYSSAIQTLLVSTFKKKLSQLRKITVTSVT